MRDASGGLRTEWRIVYDKKNPIGIARERCILDRVYDPACGTGNFFIRQFYEPGTGCPRRDRSPSGSPDYRP
jgi:hypothetical protein